MQYAQLGENLNSTISLDQMPLGLETLRESTRVACTERRVKQPLRHKPYNTAKQQAQDQTRQRCDRLNII